MIQFRVLGPLEVDAGSGPISLGGPRQRAVLAHLLIRANQVVPADTLVEEIWGEEPPEKARGGVQAYVSHLRKALGDDRIQSHAPGYRLRVDPAELDVARFDALVRDAKKALGVDPNLAVGTLDDALALWRGPALADLADQASLLAEAARLDELRLQAQEDRIDALLASGAPARAIGGLEVLLARHPLRERLWSLLMLALYREGRQGEALQAYQRVRELLAEELGIDPSPALQMLHEQVLKQDPGLELRGEPLRGYRLLEKIGEGRTGAVFRAIQPHVGRDVAVKIIYERLAADPAFVRRFEPEAQAAAALEHPHIAPVYDYWREPGRAYVVSRYLRGGSLRASEERGESLPGDQALRVVEQIASALAFAHRQDVAHGNVGSSNVLFDADGNAYLSDFRIGVGPTAEPADDLRRLAGMVRRWAPKDTRLAELAERAEIVGDGLEAEALADAARSALLPGAAAGLPRVVDRNPYKGLRAFAEADARDFFGRGELTHRLIARLREPAPGSRFLAVVGPSGGGKSSVTRAGLVPAIRRGALGDAEACFITEMFPGAHPLEELEAALLRIAVRQVPRLPGILEAGSRGLLQAVDLIAPGDAEVVLVVDQFEEVFTLTADERERELFLESLRVATVDPDSRLRVIVTLRADFYDRPLIYPRFGELLAARTEAVLPLTPDELEQAIRAPAEQVGVRAEPGLVAEVIADVAHQPGGLPLLQYALTELFERRSDGKLALSSYEVMGRVSGALSARADRIYQATDADGRQAIKQVFLRLVTLGEGRQDTRRRVARSELDSLDVDQVAIEGVLDALGRHRLLTFDREPSTREPTVEIAHEALLGAWRRLRTWIDDAREDLRQNRSLARAAAEWRGSGMDPSFLLRGTRLEQLEQWAPTTDLAIGQPDRAYLKASLDQRERERAEEQARHERETRIERRSRSRLRALVAVLSVAAVVAGWLTVVATDQSQRAEREARIAAARELAAAAAANLQVDPELSVLLAAEAVGRTRSVDGSILPEAEEALHRAVVASRTGLSVPGLGGTVDWSRKGLFVTEGPEGTGIVDIRNASTGDSVHNFIGHDTDVNDVAFSPDGTMLATTGDDGRLRVWDPSTGELLSTASVEPNATVFGPSFSPDGSLVAAGWTKLRTIRVMDPANGRVLKTLHDMPEPTKTDFSPDGRLLAVAGELDTVVIDLETGEEALDLQESGPAQGVAWSPDGRYIAAAGVDAGGQVWDAATGALAFALVGQPELVASVTWSPDSSRLATGGSDSFARIWKIGEEGERLLLSLSAPETSNGIGGLAFSPDGTQLMAAGDGVRIWDVGPTGDAEWANLPDPVGGGVEFMPDGRRVAAGSGWGLVRVWDPQTDALHTIGRPTDPSDWGVAPPFDVSPDGKAVAIAGPDTTVRAWEAATGRQLFTVTHPSPVLAVAWSPDGTRLVTADEDGRATIVDQAGHTIRVLPPVEGCEATYGIERRPTCPIRGAQFSPDGHRVAVSYTTEQSDKSHVAIWAWEPDQIVQTISTPAGTTQVAFDPSGSRLTAASGAGTVWDVDSGTRLATLAGHSGAVSAIAISPDGTRVATGGEDTTIRLFDADTGQPVLILRGHSCAVSGVAFSPDGTKLASESTCDGVRIWALDIDDLLAIADREVTRSLTSDECRQYLHLDQCPLA